MENRINKSAVRENFSANARSYDNNNDIQNDTARMLIRLLPSKNIDTILEIGCGSGNYTRLLREAFDASRIQAVDISAEMVRVAREKMADGNTFFLTADAETAEFTGKFDLITSNAVLHWLSDLDGAIGKLRGALNSGGSLAFSIFGPDTFAELKTSLADAAGKAVPMTSDLFHNKDKVEAILKKHFKDVRITEGRLNDTHSSLRSLLEKIKYSGTRGNGAGLNKIWSPSFLRNIEEAYLKRFGAVKATYQIFFCEAA